MTGKFGIRLISSSRRIPNRNRLCFTLQWHHNDRDYVSNHQPHDCLLNFLFGRKTKKTSKLRVTGLCAGNSPRTGECPARRASDAENVSILRHEIHNDDVHISYVLCLVRLWHIYFLQIWYGKIHIAAPDVSLCAYLGVSHDLYLNVFIVINFYKNTFVVVASIQ